MREAAFINQNLNKWKMFEEKLKQPAAMHPDQYAELYIELTDDLSYAKTFYPKSNSIIYLNGLAAKVHQHIYKNKKESRNRIKEFWKTEAPLIVSQYHRQLLIAFVVFLIAILIGAVSTANDDTFVRLILGDAYVNMTLENIEKGDPMAVYKQAGEVEMFLGITINNIRVALFAFAAGALLSLGTVLLLFYNGVMLGCFQYFFFQKGLFWESARTIWIHGTIEISVIIIAGCAGMVMGNSIMFPGTYTRVQSFRKGAKDGLKIVMSTVPFFIVAGTLEGFVTRYTGMPLWLSLMIIGGSFVLIVYYYILYPIQLSKQLTNGKQN